MSNRTQKDIKQDIDTLESQILDIKNVAKHCPEIIELETKARELRNSYWEEIRSQVSVWNSDIDALKKELKNKKEEKQIQISERVQKWLRHYLSGVSFGYNEPRISWISEDERFVIITSPGGTAGTGTPMGTGGYYYAASTHWIAETTNDSKYIDWSDKKRNKYKEHEGRLTKDIKKQMIEFTENLRKNDE